MVNFYELVANIVVKMNQHSEQAVEIRMLI